MHAGEINYQSQTLKVTMSAAKKKKKEKTFPQKEILFLSYHQSRGP
jgi:hypothetical protein